MTNEHGWNLDNSYTNLPSPFYSKQKPTPVKSPELVIVNERLAEALGLEAGELRGKMLYKYLQGISYRRGLTPLHRRMRGINLDILQC